MDHTQRLFIALAVDGEVDQGRWLRFCHLNKIPAGVASVAFASALARGVATKRLTQPLFADALAEVLKKENRAIETVVASLVNYRGNAEQKKGMRGPVRFFYDKTTYTGTQKKVAEKITEIFKIHDLSELCDRSQCDARGRKISAPPAPGFSTHEDISKKAAARKSLTPRSSTPATPRSAPIPTYEEETTQLPPVPIEENTTSNQHNQPTTTTTHKNNHKTHTTQQAEHQPSKQQTEQEDVQLFSNIPTFTYTPVWPSTTTTTNTTTTTKHN